MTAYWYALLAPVKLTSTTNTIRVTENSVTEDKTVGTVGPTYYLRGDGTSSDLLEAVRAAFQSHSGANTYSTTLVAKAVLGATSFDVSIRRATGTNLWSWDAATSQNTFDPSLVGFGAYNLSGSTGIINDNSPTSAWMSPMPVSEDTLSFEAFGTQAVMRGGQIYDFDNGGPYTRRMIRFSYVPEDRTLTFTTTTDAARTFKTFWGANRNGKVMELHRITMTTDRETNPFSSSSLIGKFVFDEESKNTFEPVRMPSQALYSWSIGLREYVA